MKSFKVIITLIFILSITSFAHDDLDKMPKIKGGVEELAKNIKYPESAKKEGIMGKVFVRATIDKNGNVVSTEVVESINQDLDKAAINAVESTQFIPGEKDGKKVKAEVTIPISFKLDGC